MWSKQGNAKAFCADNRTEKNLRNIRRFFSVQLERSVKPAILKALLRLLPTEILKERGTMEISQAARKYREKLKKQMEDAPLPLEYLMMQDRPITQDDLDKLSQSRRYEHRERIPEVLLQYADLYNELTGQEPTKRSHTDWIDTFWEWKDEGLSEDNIRAAWAQAQSERGFTVGRPGALTITAIGMKSKSKPAMPKVNRADTEKTQKLLEEKWNRNFVPMPEDERKKIRNILGKATK